MPPKKRRDFARPDAGHQLCVAAQQGDGAAVARLLAAGADPNDLVAAGKHPSSGEVVQSTALCVAAFGKQGDGAAMARLLLAAGADPSLAGSGGLTPLMVAAGGQMEVLRLLLARGVVVDAVKRGTGGTAFHSACYDNQPECAEALARAGCDVDIKDSNGLTGRDIAEQEGHTAVVQRLHRLDAEHCTTGLGEQPPVGAVAQVRGLVGAAEHNGQRAAVRRHLPAKGRFELELIESGQTICVKPANFELLVVPVGLAIEVHGLVGAVEHNGKKGVVESRVGENGRCGVRLPGRATPLGLKPANLQPANQAVALEPPEPAGASPAGAAALMQQLYDAVVEGDGVAVSRLLAAGADPNAWVPGRTASWEMVQSTALCEAAGRGRLEVARLLLEAGADPSRAADTGCTPLFIAASGGQLEVLRLLLVRGAAMDAVHRHDGATAFHSACYDNQPECVEALARAGCDVGLKDIGGLTGREIAEAKGHTAVVERLRAVVSEQLRAAQAAARAAPEPEPAAVVGDGGLAEQLLVAAALEGDGAAVARLLAAGTDPNASVAGQNPSGEVFPSTALVMAATTGRLEEARLLLEAGADPSLAGGDGTTPLMNAAGAGQLDVLRLLLGRGAALEATHPGTGATAFHAACYNNQPDCAEALARAGCDIGSKSKDGFTGRQLAEAQGYDAMAARLRALEAEHGGGGGGRGRGTSGAKKKRKKRPKKKQPIDLALEPEPEPALLQPEPDEPQKDQPEPEAPDEPEPDELEPEAPSGPMAEFDEAAVLAWLAAVPGLTEAQRAAAAERMEEDEYDGTELAVAKPKSLLRMLKGTEAEGAVPLLLAARNALLEAEEAARTTAAVAAAAAIAATAMAATEAVAPAAAAAAAAAAVPEPVPAAAAQRPSCSICMEPYSMAGGVVPRMLVTCGHDFCEGCLDAMLRCAAPNRATACSRACLNRDNIIGQLALAVADDCPVIQ
jgi:ankyrin repeat protein